MILLGVALILFFGLPQSAVGQCGNYELEGCLDGEHAIGSGNFVKNVHSYCAVCVVGQCHPFCNPTEEDADVQLAYEAAVEAASGGDLDAVVALAPKTNGFVFFNPSREAVQIWNCEKDRIMASLSVPDGMMGSVALTEVPILEN